MEDLKTCHQCRQRTTKFVASCKNLKNKKPCTMKFCTKCLLNRYGENAAEVDRLNNWICPKCRDICNCSICMKRKGLEPTGKLAPTAKAEGYSSVSNLLEVRGYGTSEFTKGGEIHISPTKAQMVGASDSTSKKVATRETKKVVSSENIHEKEKPPKWALRFNCLKPFLKDESEEKTYQNCEGIVLKDDINDEKSLKVEEHLVKPNIEESSNNNPFAPNTTTMDQSCEVTVLKDDAGDEESHKVKEHIMKPLIEESEHNNTNPLSHGTILTDIMGIELAPQDIGNVLQLLEFCKVFGEVLDMKTGEVEAILRQLVYKKNLCQRENIVLIQFQIKLLTLILNESGNGSPSLCATDGKNSWFEALVKFISGSNLVCAELQLDCLNEGIDKYHDLDLSKKLSLLNFLCDEALCTQKLRSFIDDQNLKFDEKRKEAKAKVSAATKRVKSLEQTLQDEETKANISDINATISSSEHEALLLKIRSEVAEARADMIEAKGMVPKRKQRYDALRTEPMFLDGDSKIIWKLKCYNDEKIVLLQDINAEEGTGERWFIYSDEKKPETEKYISSRAEELKIQNDSCTLKDDSNDANMYNLDSSILKVDDRLE